MTSVKILFDKSIDNSDCSDMSFRNCAREGLFKIELSFCSKDG
jgi:hypothetical protein